MQELLASKQGFVSDAQYDGHKTCCRKKDHIGFAKWASVNNTVLSKG